MILEPIGNRPIKFIESEISNKEKVLEKEFVPKIFRELENEEEKNYRKERILKSNKVKDKFRINIYFVVLIIFLIGIVTGSIVFRVLIEDENVKETVIEKFSMIDLNEVDRETQFKKSFSRNMQTIAIYWIVGISVVGAPLLLLLCFYKGFTTAFVIASFLLKYGFIEGNIYIFKNLFLYYLFLIFAIILLTVSSIKVMTNVLKQKKDIRLELVRHSIFTIVGIILMLASTVIETKM